MKITKILALAAIIALGLGCGYSKHAVTPPAPGTTPIITVLNPPNGAANTALNLEVDGTSFAGNAFVKFNGVKMTATSTAAGKITVAIPASAVMMTSGTVLPVTVTNPGMPGGIYGGGTQDETSVAMNFTIN